MNKESIALCPHCKTGADMLKLDAREPMCPYLCFYGKDGCMKYVPLSGGDKV